MSITRGRSIQTIDESQSQSAPYQRALETLINARQLFDNVDFKDRVRGRDAYLIRDLMALLTELFWTALFGKIRLKCLSKNLL